MAGGSKSSKRAWRAEFDRNALLPRSRQRLDTLSRMDVDSKGLKTETIPLRHPKTQLPNIQLLEPPANKLDPIDIESDNESDDGKKERGPALSQTRTVINDFMNVSSSLQDVIMEGYKNDFSGENCSCGRGLREVRCDECLQFPISCRSCFTESHYYNPFHWAYLWDSSRARFKRTDYSAILELVNETGAIQLGHVGERQACPFNETSIPFIVVHTNGIHTTRIRICRCPGASDKTIQLTRARLFPATVSDPRTAFTFQALKQFHMHGLQSKSSAFDYVVSLRRLTDNIFTHKVPDPYKALLRVSRIFDFLSLQKWVGQAHGIDAVFPLRPKGNIVFYCPACIERGVNTSDKDIQECPQELRHLITKYKMVDGNHHANRFAKNTDTHDISLWNEWFAYFPSRESYSQYLSNLPNTKEKSVCNFITAVNAQDKKKFRGNDETGLINLLCSHVMVESSVDMYFGERFAYTDFGLARALDNRSLTDIPVILAYDCACSYSVNAHHRFEAHIPRHVDTITKMVFTIDSLHVHDHQDRCMYLYGTYYKDCIGHFTAVGTEQFWAENNQIASQARQMNPGHRHDKLTQSEADWNLKKVIRMARQIIRDLRLSWTNYVEKRDFLKKLSDVLYEHIPKWAMELGKKPTINSKGEVESIYRHTPSKVPSMDTVLRKLTSKDFSFASPSTSSWHSTPSIVHFLADGINIKAIQVLLRQLIQRHESHPLLATKRDLDHTREELQKRLERFRNDQLTYMEGARPIIVNHELQPVETERLFLPSEFSREQRDKFGLGMLAELEAELWEGQASECILRLRCIMKLISAFHGERRKNPGTQREGTRSRSRIQVLEFLKERVLNTYSDSRSALDLLGKLDAITDRYPRLTEHDLGRKSTRNKRSLGDTYRADGGLWGLGSNLNSSSGHSIEHPPQLVTSEDGKLWSSIAGLSDRDFEEWEKEEDRVQWFRAWAETMRWMEEFELKHMEMVRVIRSFHRMRDVWENLAGSSTKSGYGPFARQQADIYSELAKDAEELFEKYGEKRFVHPESTLIQAVIGFRSDELAWFKDIVGVSSTPI